MYSLLDNGPSSSSRPLKTSDVLVVGRSHEFVEDEKKFRIPVKCSYCDGVVQGKGRGRRGVVGRRVQHDF